MASNFSLVNESPFHDPLVQKEVTEVKPQRWPKHYTEFETE